MSRPRAERPRPTTVLSHLAVMVAVSAVMGVVVAGLAIPFAGVLGFAARNTAETTDDLPLELETGKLAQQTQIFAADGSLLATYFDENRIEVGLKQVSKTMRQALIAIEDYRYYQHGALDVKGTARALLTNLGSGGVVQGGSSITQQLVKQTLLNAATTPKERKAVTDDTYARKLKELRFAIALEKKHSKDWILQRYLNTVYFGDGAYGIQAAAKHYFDTNAKNLNLNQSAILAGLVQNPTGFDPTNHPGRALERRDVVLDRMAELNVITEAKAEEVKARKLKLDAQPRASGCIASRAPFFCDYVLEYLKNDKSLGRNKRERDQVLKSGGLRIYTTIDVDDQVAADDAVRANVQQTDLAVGALAMVEPGTGYVKALAQSRPMGAKKKEGETYLNYTVPTKYGDSAGFQAGSTFKAFVLAQAIEKGVPLDTVLPAPATAVMQEEDYENCDGNPYGYGEFDARNSVESIGGAENLYTGTRRSINTFFYNLEKETGICAPFELAKKMGVQLNAPEGLKNDDGDFVVLPERIPNFTLGVADVSPLEMAEAYATFAARGVHCSALPVTKIENANGKVLKKYEPRCESVMQDTTADAVNDILTGVLTGSGFAAPEALSVPAAGKTGTTGTTGKSPAVWFMGYTPELATASMIAGATDQGTPLGLDGLSINGNIVSASGSRLAAPMWSDAMRAIDLDYVDFVAPTSVDGYGATSVSTRRSFSDSRGDRRGRGRR